MRFHFVATEATSWEDDETILSGVAGQTHYLVFQRSLPVGGDDDWGIHVEFDDQINSGYGKIARCSLSQARLRVEFTEPIDSQRKYSEAEVELRLGDGQFQSLVSGLRRVFSQWEELLSVES